MKVVHQTDRLYRNTAKVPYIYIKTAMISHKDLIVEYKDKYMELNWRYLMGLFREYKPKDLTTDFSFYFKPKLPKKAIIEIQKARRYI